MRTLRSIPALIAALIAPLLLVAGIGHACQVSSAMVTGKFDAEGGFHVIGAMTPAGQEIPELTGKTISRVSTTADAAIASSDYVDRQIWLVGDIDGEAGTLNILGWTDDEKSAAKHVAMVASSGGEGCSAAQKAECAAKGITCESKGASAATASAGSSCSSKGASAKTANAGSSCCAGKSASAATASAGSSCSSKGASAKTASAGSSCSGKGASAATAGAGSSCSGGKAETRTVDAKAADGETYQIIYAVSGMTCGGCENKVVQAVQGLEMEGIVSVVADHEEGRAIVNCSGDVCRETVEKAISGAGFPAELVVTDEAEKPAPKAS